MSLKQLDVRGEICPFPMMKTVQALKKLGPNDQGLEVITDHAPARHHPHPGCAFGLCRLYRGNWLSRMAYHLNPKQITCRLRNGFRWMLYPKLSHHVT